MQNTLQHARIDAEIDLKAHRATLKEALAWVQHWQTDIACGLSPTLESLKTAEIMIRTALEVGR